MKIVFWAMPLLLVTAVARADVKSEIDAANQKFGAAYVKGDAAGLAQLHTVKANVLPPGGDIVTGRDDIQKLWAGAMQSGLKLTGHQTLSIEEQGDAAVEISRFSAEVPGPEKQVIKLDGKSIVVWKRTNGTWLVDSDIWNLNK